MGEHLLQLRQQTGEICIWQRMKSEIVWNALNCILVTFQSTRSGNLHTCECTCCKTGKNEVWNFHSSWDGCLWAKAHCSMRIGPLTRLIALLHWKLDQVTCECTCSLQSAEIGGILLECYLLTPCYCNLSIVNQEHGNFLFNGIFCLKRYDSAAKNSGLQSTMFVLCPM